MLIFKLIQILIIISSNSKDVITTFSSLQVVSDKAATVYGYMHHFY